MGKSKQRSSYDRQYYLEHLSVIKERQREYRQSPRGREIIRQLNVKYRRRLKIEVLTHYGGGRLACGVCSENRLACLTIDHIEPKMKVSPNYPAQCYRWLKQQGYPDGYQTLCMNCQFIKADLNKEYRKKESCIE